MRRLLVRSAVLVAYAAVVRRLGGYPERFARAAGIDPLALRSPDQTVSGAAVYRLIERTAAILDAPDLGLLIARERSSLAYFGALGALARDEPFVRGALQRLATDTHLHTTTATLLLEERRGIATVELRVHPAGDSGLRQVAECGVGLLFWTLRHWLGPAWHPTSVHLAHARALPPGQHESLFGCPVRFAAAANVLLLPSADLDRPTPTSESGLRRYTKVTAVSLACGDDGTVRRELVADTIARMLVGGECRSDAVAGELGMDRRTLHRHLARQDSSFSTLLHETRLSLAREQLRSGALTISEIADSLGFRSVSAFSRWCVARTGLPPSRWRERRAS